MDLRQLEMAISVADNASFTRASRQLYVAQSAISRKIKMLEEELGEPIFKRVNKKIYVTPAGETLLRYARRIFQDMRNAKLEISEIAHLERGHLRLGAGMLACTYILPPVLEKFKSLHPRIELEVITGPTDSLLSKLGDNLIELGVFTLPVKHPDLQVVPLTTEEMVVVTSPKHPVLSKETKISPEDLQKYPLILFPKGARTRNVLEAFFHDAGIAPRIVMEAENVALIKPLVKIDLGISIIPLHSVFEELQRGELHSLKIRDFKLVRKVGLVYHRSEYVPKMLAELIRLFKECQRKRP
ncbi:MAG TPA: LysR family transcriptional regulator [Edaphobacter sp.]|nr:LysR family transcriptional regulator [Edaphobacter sp.]